MAFKRKHLDALSLASIPYRDEPVPDAPDIKFISVAGDNIISVIDFIHKHFPEDAPIIPLKHLSNSYILYVHEN